MLCHATRAGASRPAEAEQGQKRRSFGSVMDAFLTRLESHGREGISDKASAVQRNRMMELYRTKPEILYARSAAGPREKLGLIADEDDEAEGGDGGKPYLRAYVRTMLTPEVKANLRAYRELETLAVIVDLLARVTAPNRQVVQAKVVALHRFLALETATEEKSWDNARWMELLAPSTRTGAGTDLQHVARAAQKEELKLHPETSAARRTRGKNTKETDSAAAAAAKGM